MDERLSPYAPFRPDGTFRKAELEHRFLFNRWPRHAHRIRIVSLLTALAYISGIYVDYLRLGSSKGFYVLMATRGLTFAMALVCIALTYTPKGRLRVHWAIFLYFVFLAFSEGTELVFKPEMGDQSLPFLAFIMLAYYMFFPAPLAFALSGGIFGAITYLPILSWAVGQSADTVLTQAMTFALINLFGVFFVRSMNRADRVEFQALEEQRELNRKLQEEIQEREKAERKLLKIATTDELTRACNRRRFMELADREIFRTGRTARPLCLLFMDIDHFKFINDTHGHDVGDGVLASLAQTCRKNIRGLDVFARMGGEEFALLLPETGLNQAVRMAERLRRLIAETPFSKADKTVPVTVSIGVAAWDDERTDTLEKLLKAADRALYRAKRRGRDRVVADLEPPSPKGALP